MGGDVKDLKPAPHPLERAWKKASKIIMDKQNRRGQTVA